MKKEFLKEKGTWKVTFTLPKKAVNGAKQVVLVGDFNNWDTRGVALEAIGSEVYETSLELDPGRSYQFRYLIDNARWENDWQADDYIPSPFNGVNNSVVVLKEAENTVSVIKEERKETIALTTKKEVPTAHDDLTKIEGVGKKLEEVLQSVGITSFKALSKLNPNDIKAMLIAANPRYKMHNPSHWPEQALLAAQEKWEELKELQAELKGGKKK